MKNHTGIFGSRMKSEADIDAGEKSESTDFGISLECLLPSFGHCLVPHLEQTGKSLEDDTSQPTTKKTPSLPVRLVVSISLTVNRQDDRSNHYWDDVAPGAAAVF
jgi:hypothetical protein